MLQRSVFHIAEAVAHPAPLRDPLRADKLVALARRGTSLTEFGETPFNGPLQNFLHACLEEANLSLVGRIAIRWDVVRFLSNLLRLSDEETRAPEVLDQPVARPIFISGLPRSGTTFLHSLLAEGPANLVPRVWQLIHPYPPRNSCAGPDLRPQWVGRQLHLFGLLAPDFRRMQPINAGSPQECSEIRRMSSPACVSTRRIAFPAIAVGSTKLDTSTLIGFTDASCSTSNINQPAAGAGCSSVLITCLRLPRSGRFTRMHVYCSSIGTRSRSSCRS
jgi:Sulfotransferase family